MNLRYRNTNNYQSFAQEFVYCKYANKCRKMSFYYTVLSNNLCEYNRIVGECNEFVDRLTERKLSISHFQVTCLSNKVLQSINNYNFYLEYQREKVINVINNLS